MVADISPPVYVKKLFSYLISVHVQAVILISIYLHPYISLLIAHPINTVPKYSAIMNKKHGDSWYDYILSHVEISNAKSF